MAQRFVTIWFRNLKTDWFSIRQPGLLNLPFVLSAPEHGRLVITAANEIAKANGVHVGMAVADARAISPSLEVLQDDPQLPARVLKAIAVWCIRYTNIVAIDLPEGIIMNVTGAAHLWGGELPYIKDIQERLKKRGYQVGVAMADSIGAAWAIAHFGNGSPIIETGKQMEALLPLPAAALRLETPALERLNKLGLEMIRSFIGMPRSALRRRFGKEMLLKLDQALGHETESLISIQPVVPYCERLPCLDPIVTAKGIEIALDRLLRLICERLQKENTGIRRAVFTGFRIDGILIKIEIGTHHATFNADHLYKLFEEKISSLEPGPGIEVFMMEVLKSDRCIARQEKLWDSSSGLDAPALSELLDRITNRFGMDPIHRFLPAEHYLPEKSYSLSDSLQELKTTKWLVDRPRPLHLLSAPQPVEVTAPVPDYPPMLFRYLGKLHKIKKADGPERIEQEWCASPVFVEVEDEGVTVQLWILISARRMLKNGHNQTTVFRL